MAHCSFVTLAALSLIVEHWTWWPIGFFRYIKKKLWETFRNPRSNWALFKVPFCSWRLFNVRDSEWFFLEKNWACFGRNYKSEKESNSCLIKPTGGYYRPHLSSERGLRAQCNYFQLAIHDSIEETNKVDRENSKHSLQIDRATN